MSEASDRYSTIAAGFGARVDGVPAGGWDAPSPCSEWTARDVVVHVIDVHRRVHSSLQEGEPAVEEPEDDLAAAWSRATTTVREALDDPVRASQTVSGMFGEQPFESLVGRLLCADTLIHTWDLARATGQPDSLDPDAAVQVLSFLIPLDDAVRRPGGFGPKIDPPTGADAQTRLLNFAGRQV